MTAASGGFVKSATTTTSVDQSQAAIIAMLRRYGASGFGFRTDGDTVRVTFFMPRQGGGEPHEVEIPIDIVRVRARLADAVKRQKKRAPAGDNAERVAWRVLYLWIDAALAAVSIGAQSLDDAFLAHMVIPNRHGTLKRVADHMAPMLASGADVMPTALVGDGGAR
jgi:hypothetical protein